MPTPRPCVRILLFLNNLLSLKSKDGLTFDELKTAIRNNLIVESDISILVDEMKVQAKTTEEKAFYEALTFGYTIDELDKKTANA